jgi:hypothetical protein
LGHSARLFKSEYCILKKRAECPKRLDAIYSGLRLVMRLMSMIKDLLIDFIRTNLMNEK